MVLAWAWLGVQLIAGVPWGSLSPQPPARSQIRYADLEGKRTQAGIVLRYPAHVLAADPPASPFRLHSDLQFGDHDGRVIVTLQKVNQIECGWPLLLVSARLWHAWDVTDPEREFVPAAGVFPPQPHWESAGIVWSSADGSRNLRLGLMRAGVWSPVAIAVLPIAPIVVMWIAFAVRQRRRRVRRQCLECGHARDPQGESIRCTECGVEFAAESCADGRNAMRCAFRSVRWPVVAMLLWLTFTCAVFIAFWLTSRAHHIDEQQLRESAQFRADYARQENLATPGEMGLTTYERRIGWPWTIVTIQQWRWYSVKSDATYAPVPVDRDITFRDEHPQWDWYAIDDDDPYVLNWYLINWRPGIVTVAATAFAAGNVLLLLQWRCRARSRRSIAAESGSK